MQISAMNPVNFKSNYQTIESSTETNSKTDIKEIQKAVENYHKTVEQAPNNTSIITVLSAFAVFLTLAKKGRKIVDPVFNALIIANDFLAQKALKFASKIFKKNSESIKMLSNKAAGFKEAALNTTIKNINTQKLEKTLEQISPNLKEKFNKVLGLVDYNKSSLLRTLAATIGALRISDSIANGTEQVVDSYNINGAENELIKTLDKNGIPTDKKHDGKITSALKALAKVEGPTKAIIGELLT